MLVLPDQIRNLIESFSNLPGVGQKTATRFALSLINRPVHELDAFAFNLKNLLSVEKCQECGLFADEPICRICASEHRKESGLICVVEQFTDAMAIEGSNRFSGLFHVLGGVLNPLMGVGPSEIAFDSLMERISKNNVCEIILALNPSVEGDATSAFIKDEILKRFHDKVSVERIGLGMPVGGALEFLDPMTISKALENRRRF